MNKVIQVRVVPKAGKNAVEKFGNGLKVRLTAPAVEGKANKSLIEILAKHFNIKKAHIRIIKGAKSRDKLVGLIKTVRKGCG